MPQQEPKPGAVVSLSGGMDSATLLSWAIHLHGRDKVHAVSFHYGQRHSAELLHARQIANYEEVPHEIIILPEIFAGAGSSLMGDQDVEIIGSYQELAARFGSQPTVVPNRNMNFIAMMTTVALTKGVGHIYIGAHAGDAAAYHYPDCRPSFNGAMAAAIDIATEGAVVLEAPFNYLSKGQIVEKAAHLGAPLSMSLSCYNGAEPACGKCATCHERLQAFEEAGYVDPISYVGSVNQNGLRLFPLPIK